MARICIVGPSHPYRGGIAHHTALLGRAMLSEHDLSVINFTRLYPDALFPGKTQYDTSDAPLDLPMARIVDSISPPSWLRAAQRIAEFAPDRVLFQWWHPFFAPAYRSLSWALRRQCNAKQIYLCHNVVPHESSALNTTLVRTGLAGADAFVLHSQAERPALERFARGRPITVHPHPTYDAFGAQHRNRDEARARLGLSGDVLLFFGYVRAYKGLMTALDALPSILQQRHVTLVVAGEFYDDKQPYLDKIRSLGLEDRVRLFDEYIPNERVGDFFAAADLVVQPYVTATQSGISQLAFGFEKPVLATAVGGIPEAICDGKTGLLIQPLDPAALSNAVLRFFTENLGPQMSENIHRDRTANGWPQLAQVICTL
ncbi:MAG: hypothetical protein RJA70_787 [Pseudomonadota bacterium]|jgi:glycosyltransferase involved in cell wall biosynthesis